MGYYIRILGLRDPDIHVDELVQSLTADGSAAKFEFDSTEDPNKWTMLDILNSDGESLARLERNPITEGSLGHEELAEFKDDIQNSKPASAVKWLTGFFGKVKVIYAFQMLNAAFEDGNFEIINNIKIRIWNKTEGILQADNEGFSNEDGYHILWQFSDTVTGDLSCAVRNWLGKWDKFVMDLGDTNQRQEFKEGKVPENSKRI